MKKIKICLLLFVSVALVFAGCSGEKYLKTTSTSLCLANFYEQNYISSLANFDNVEQNSSVFLLEEDKIAYSNYVKSFYQILPEQRCIMSVIDFYIAMNQTEGTIYIDPNAKTKVYEYDTVFSQELLSMTTTSGKASSASGTKAVILVQSAKSNKEITAYLFYKNASDSYDISDLIADVDSAHCTYIFTFNKIVQQTNTYTFTYGKNKTKTGCETSVSFNETRGCLNYEIKTVIDDTGVNFSSSVYKYSNYTIGVRAVSSYNLNSQNTKIVYEQLGKDFYKKLKLGQIKNESDMLSMDAMKEDSLATQNISDLTGFVVENNTQNNVEQEETPITISYFKYGGTN